VSKWRELRKYSPSRFDARGQWVGHSLRRRLSLWLGLYRLTRRIARRMWHHQIGVCRFCGVDVGLDGVAWRAGLTCWFCHENYKSRCAVVAPEVRAAAIARLKVEREEQRLG